MTPRAVLFAYLAVSYFLAILCVPAVIRSIRVDRYERGRSWLRTVTMLATTLLFAATWVVSIPVLAWWSHRRVRRRT